MSSSDLAVSVRGVGKEYTIRHDAALRPTTLAEAVARRLRHPFARSQKERFWALSDVSFDVRRGEVLGLIGGNGAGKSTLLKILSRITEMTRGEVDLYGRVGSLLEVGTGFNQELTGRENIFLNGAILGMTRAEVRSQFDDIVAFAGVERFLDTPVKHYSSGMYVRLAFAVAAHLRSEILIVDEVLAVGDDQFQRKCLGKMRDVATSGRTVILVSHNMVAISNLCSRALVLRAGCLAYVGDVHGAVQQYLAREANELVGDLRLRRDRVGSGEIRALSVALRTSRGLARAVAPFEPFEITVGYDASQPLNDVVITLDVDLPDGTRLTTLHSAFRDERFRVSRGQGAFTCTVAGLPLRPDTYVLNVAIGGSSQTVYDGVDRAMSFEITPVDVFGTGRLPMQGQGPLLSDYHWHVVEPALITQ